MECSLNISRKVKSELLSFQCLMKLFKSTTQFIWHEIQSKEGDNLKHTPRQSKKGYLWSLSNRTIHWIVSMAVDGGYFDYKT